MLLAKPVYGAGDRLQHRPSGVEGGGRAGAHHRQSALARTCSAATDRCVHHLDAMLGQPSRAGAGEIRRYRAALQNHRARRQTLDGAVFAEQHRLDLFGVDHQNDHHRASLNRLLWRGSRRAAGIHQGVHSLLAHIEAAHIELPLDQGQRDAHAHRPQAQYADGSTLAHRILALISPGPHSKPPARSCGQAL